MKKLNIALAIITGIPLIALIVLFSPIGNGIVQGIVEGKINEKAPALEAKFVTFSFGISSLDIDLLLKGGTRIIVQGSYSLFSQSVDLQYNIEAKNLHELQPLTQQKLQGGFNVKGSVKGGMDEVAITGESDIAKSQTRFDASIIGGNPSSVNASIKNARLESLLHLVSQPEYAKALINLDAAFTDLNPESAKGNAKLTVTKGDVNEALFAKQFQLTLPQTAFDLNLDAKAAAPKADYDLKLNSNLAKITSSGNLDLTQKALDVIYNVAIEELGVLNPITQMELRGPLNTHGNVKGTFQSPTIKGKSDVAGSQTDYTLVIADSAPKSADVAIKSLKLDKLLYMINQPRYASANIDLDAKLNNLDPKALGGDVKLKATQGKTNAPLVSELAGMKVPVITFNLTSDTNIKQSLAQGESHLKTSLADLDLLKTQLNLNTQQLDSDYKAVVPDLDKLYFATEQHLKGGITITGHLHKSDKLDFTAHSDFLGGTIDAAFNDPQAPFGDGTFKATIKGIKTLLASDLMIQPRIFDSALDGSLDYNLGNKKGQLLATLHDGHILHNKFTRLLLSTTGFDITKEVYVKSDLKSDINDNLITSDLAMKSNLSSISTQGALVDTKKKEVDARINLGVDESTIGVKIKGKLENPGISLDVKDFLQNKAKETIQNEIQKKLLGTQNGDNKQGTNPANLLKDPEKLLKDPGSVLKGLFGN